MPNEYPGAIFGMPERDRSAFPKAFE